MNELANQRQVLQKIDGWKVYHLSTQMESMVETEVEFAKKLNALHKVGWITLSGSSSSQKITPYLSSLSKFVVWNQNVQKFWHH